MFVHLNKKEEKQKIKSSAAIKRINQRKITDNFIGVVFFSPIITIDIFAYYITLKTIFLYMYVICK